MVLKFMSAISSAMDVGRALLKFAVGYPLGEKGLDWLKIHLVNLNGEKKKYVQINQVAYCCMFEGSDLQLMGVRCPT